MEKNDEIGVGGWLFSLFAVLFLIYNLYTVFGGHIFIGFVVLGVIGLGSFLWALDSNGTAKEGIVPKKVKG